ncbi:proton channel OtopLc-like isoform X2 [Tachypleus tridentatus]|uniref:proton channel OtopLc-like isoform X2 n=1 Tax=Tachypleus tridentatus TaxID=6853 RepID=UPI003FCF6EF2
MSKVGTYNVVSRTQQFITLSSIYAQLLVVVCITFFTSEVVTSEVPFFFFEAFYLYLYIGSLVFLLYTNTYILHDAKHLRYSVGRIISSSVMNSLRKIGLRRETEDPRNHKTHKPRNSYSEKSHGSLFLRIGAIAFGLGTMIYSGLEFGKFFELPVSSPCYSVLLGVNPIFQMIFTFFQMYFIFLNARLNIQKFKTVARFGLMHMVATDLCVWLRTLGKETLYEISEELIQREKINFLEELIVPIKDNSTKTNNTNICQKTNIMGDIVSHSSPFLFPFIVEYSLIGAAILYVMWQNIGKTPVLRVEIQENDGVLDSSIPRASTKMNCVGASKGLFLGLLVLAVCLICLIVFFVLVYNEEYKMLAIILGDVSHCVLLVLGIFAIIVGFIQIRPLRYFSDREREQFSSMLLGIAGFGLFLYAIFGIMAGSLSSVSSVSSLLVLINSCLTLVQVITQSLFISDVVCRSTYLPEHNKQKPGKQVVTFLMISNITFWIVYTFQMQKVEANPVELNFFGMWGWTIIVRITLPLAIFYRFHSAVTFAEVWKNSYKDITT